jgi:PBP1b-binding outer membrane lipoprotein LpoB
MKNKIALGVLLAAIFLGGCASTQNSEVAAVSDAEVKSDQTTEQDSNFLIPVLIGFIVMIGLM